MRDSPSNPPSTSEPDPEPRPAPVKTLKQRAPGIALALLLGSLGGWAASALGLPLPWMIGAMTATTVAAVAGAPKK